MFEISETTKYDKEKDYVLQKLRKSDRPECGGLYPVRVLERDRREFLPELRESDRCRNDILYDVRCGTETGETCNAAEIKSGGGYTWNIFRGAGSA